jgi:hypothetical protein
MYFGINVTSVHESDEMCEESYVLSDCIEYKELFFFREVWIFTIGAEDT